MHAAGCAGTHVHFEIEQPLDQLRVLTALDPAQALVSSAPYYRGQRVAACARPLVYRRRCYASFPTLGQLWGYPRSLEDWRDRRTRRFEGFLNRAVGAGCDPASVHSCFTPDDAMWSPVRLREDLGTVEWRASDTPPSLGVCQLVGTIWELLRSAVDRGTSIGSDHDADGDPLVLPRFRSVRDHADRAIQHGLTDPAVPRYLDSLGLPVEAFRPVGHRIDGLKSINPAVARSIRCRFDDRLERKLEEFADRHTEALGRRQRIRTGA